MRNIPAVFLFIMFYFDYICNDISGGWSTFPLFPRFVLVTNANLASIRRSLWGGAMKLCQCEKSNEIFII